MLSWRLVSTLPANGNYEGIMRDKGKPKHIPVHTGLKRKQQSCHNIKGDGDDSNTSPENMASLSVEACV